MAKKIKVKGKCPICGSKMIWGSCGYYMGDEPSMREYLPICTNEDCELSCGYDSDIKFRFINHRTVKIVYDGGYRREVYINPNKNGRVYDLETVYRAMTNCNIPTAKFIGEEDHPIDKHNDDIDAMRNGLLFKPLELSCAARFVEKDNGNIEIYSIGFIYPSYMRLISTSIESDRELEICFNSHPIKDERIEAGAQRLLDAFGIKKKEE